jgi:hypothetical protein
VQAVAREELLEEQELGVQVLRLGRLVHDGDGAQWRGAAGVRPLGAEHGDDGRFEGLGVGAGGHQRGRLRTAGALGAGEHGVQQRTAGVGVDLDQTELVAVEVEVMAEKDAAR